MQFPTVIDISSEPIQSIMGLTYVIHEPEVRFTVGFTIEEPGATKRPPLSKMKQGEFYVHKGSVYVGSGEIWYTAKIAEIRDFVFVPEKNYLELVFDEFKIVLHTKERAHLSSLREILYICKNRPKKASKHTVC